jgi:hypothetical protein
MSQAEKPNTTSRLSRRTALVGLSGVGSALMAPAIGHALGKAAPQTTVPTDDTELRPLWAEYVSALEVTRAAHAEFEKANAVFESELPPCPDDVNPGDHFRANKPLQHSTGRTAAWERWNDSDLAMRKIIERIQQAPISGLFGIGVKLAAVVEQPEEADYVESSAVVLTDINRMTGANFTVQLGWMDDADE